MSASKLRAIFNLTVLVTALGYFVDMFDLPAGRIVGLSSIALAAFSLWGLKETHGRDLDFVE